MRRPLFPALPVLLLAGALSSPVEAAAGAPIPPPPLPEALRANAQRVLEASLANEAGSWKRLARLTDTFGSRFSGSASLEQAIDWILAEMHADGLDNVRGEQVLVPHWMRGAESLEVVKPFVRSIPVLGLGNGLATPPEGITADVLVVKSFDELHARAAEARGRIVVWNAPFTTYAETVAYRWKGAVEAAQAGAVASLVRSVTPMPCGRRQAQSPRTGPVRRGDDGAGLRPRRSAGAAAVHRAGGDHSEVRGLGADPASSYPLIS